MNSALKISDFSLRFFLEYCTIVMINIIYFVSGFNAEADGCACQRKCTMKFSKTGLLYTQNISD